MYAGGPSDPSAPMSNSIGLGGLVNVGSSSGVLGGGGGSSGGGNSNAPEEKKGLLQHSHDESTA